MVEAAKTCFWITVGLAIVVLLVGAGLPILDHSLEVINAYWDNR